MHNVFMFNTICFERLQQCFIRLKGFKEQAISFKHEKDR